MIISIVLQFSDLKNYAIHASLKNNPKLERSIALFNGLSQWVQCMVLSKTTPQQRSDVVTKFVNVSKVSCFINMLFFCFVHFVIYSFVHTYFAANSFIYLVIHSFSQSFVQSFVQSYYSNMTCLWVEYFWFICSFIHSFICSVIFLC